MTPAKISGILYGTLSGLENLGVDTRDLHSAIGRVTALVTRSHRFSPGQAVILKNVPCTQNRPWQPYRLSLYVGVIGTVQSVRLTEAGTFEYGFQPDRTLAVSDDGVEEVDPRQFYIESHYLMAYPSESQK